MRPTFRRILITGGPRTGKTTLALKLASQYAITNLKSTDTLIDLGWSEASAAAALWFDEPGDWIIEGVAVPRAIRKWLIKNPKKQLEAEVIYLKHPFCKLSRGQRAMTKGIDTVWVGIVDDLKYRGAVFQSTPEVSTA